MFNVFNPLIAVETKTYVDGNAKKKISFSAFSLIQKWKDGVTWIRLDVNKSKADVLTPEQMKDPHVMEDFEPSSFTVLFVIANLVLFELEITSVEGFGEVHPLFGEEKVPSFVENVENNDQNSPS
jgi:hypothetical protein